MTFDRRRRRWTGFGRAFVATFVIAGAIAVSTDRAASGNGLGAWWWHSSGIVLSSSSYSASNATGFWQAVMSANQCGLLVDGLFGVQTTNATKAQQARLGLSQDGVVGVNTMYHTQNASYLDGQGDRHFRLSGPYYIDGYATEYWTYYDGMSFSVSLGWNGFSSQWLFDPELNSGWPTYLIPAYSYRTMGTHLPWVCGT